MTNQQFRSVLSALKLSQTAFALRIGVDPHTVNRWATGAIAVPKYAVYILELLEERRSISDWLAR